MEATSGSLSEQVASIEQYPLHRESVEVGAEANVLAQVADVVTSEFDFVSMINGVRVDVGDDSFLIRASAVRPLVRLTAEARTEG